MELTRENLQTLFYTIQASFNKGLGTTWSDWQKFAVVVNSATLMEKYPSTILTGAMRKWVGPRIINDVQGKLLTVLNEDYERTEGINRNDIEDDNFGFFSAIFEAIGVEAGNLWGRLACEILMNPNKWADNAAFFGTRKIGKATITNFINGDLTAANYESARELMMSYTEADGKTPLGLIPNLVVVGPSLEKKAKRIFKAELVDENGVAVSNINADDVEICVSPYISNGDWFLMNTTRGIKPLAVQKRKEGAIQRWDKDSDICVKDKNECQYGLHYRGAAAAISPHLVIRGRAV